MLLEDIKLHAGLDLEFNGGVKKKQNSNDIWCTDKVLG